MRALKMFFLTTMLLTSTAVMAQSTEAPEKPPRLFRFRDGKSINIDLLEKAMSTGYKGEPKVVVTDMEYAKELSFIAALTNAAKGRDPVFIYDVRANVGASHGGRFVLYLHEENEVAVMTTAQTRDTKSQEIFAVPYATIGLAGRPPFGTR